MPPHPFMGSTALYIINNFFLLLSQPAPIGCREITWRGRRGTDWLWSQTHGHCHASPPSPSAVALIPSAAAITRCERGWCWQGGAAEQQSGRKRSKEAAPLKTKSSRGRRRGRISTGHEGWSLRTEGGGQRGVGSSRLDGPSDALMEHGPDFRILPLPWVCFPFCCLYLVFLCGRSISQRGISVFLLTPLFFSARSLYSHLLLPLINTWLTEGDRLCRCCLPLMCRC